MLQFYSVLLIMETIGCLFLIIFDIQNSKNFIIDEKKYFVWISSGIFILFNIYMIVVVCWMKTFMKKLLST